jgi:20S proteasome subunit alpha 7
MPTKQSTTLGSPSSPSILISFSTAIGLRVKDGVVLAVEKLVTSKLLLPGANRRIQTVDRHMGVATAGLVPDGRQLIHISRQIAADFRKNYRKPIPTKVPS